MSLTLGSSHGFDIYIPINSLPHLIVIRRAWAVKERRPQRLEEGDGGYSLCLGGLQFCVLEVRPLRMAGDHCID